MTAAAKVAVQGECQSEDREMHRYCPGNVDLYAYGAPAGEQPVLKYRCGCDHHKEPGARP